MYIQLLNRFVTQNSLIDYNITPKSTPWVRVSIYADILFKVIFESICDALVEQCLSIEGGIK